MLKTIREFLTFKRGRAWWNQHRFCEPVSMSVKSPHGDWHGVVLASKSTGFRCVTQIVAVAENGPDGPRVVIREMYNSGLFGSKELYSESRP